MNCFYHFRDKSKSKLQKSAPTLNNQNKSYTPENERVSWSCPATSPCRIPELYEEKAHNLRVFTFAELRQATNNFNRLLKIGEDGFGCVYKGTIKPVKGKGERIVGHKEWVSEVQFLRMVDHHFNRALHKTISWNRRLQIMLRATQGLAYLH
ncbi:probable receptor-like protein kinase at5g47070 [Phtheirospermum japonicum]|uniref:Probable receptor-like protein kinase at5g47070 n=1 Tax=Phtheirospermum japonicum TaxID=374723 RepID=A0A830C2E8_9LAMI|nr:probable receptor-like protein kinase at5g47070 [Phtheirospermum japonicum]